LIANIQSQAKKAGIAIEEGKKPIRASPPSPKLLLEVSPDKNLVGRSFNTPTGVGRVERRTSFGIFPD